jgi:hypothetical protein
MVTAASSLIEYDIAGCDHGVANSNFCLGRDDQVMVAASHVARAVLDVQEVGAQDVGVVLDHLAAQTN